MTYRIIILAVSILLLLVFVGHIAKAGIGQYDYGDKSSQTLTAKAWQALNDKDYKAGLAYTRKCITLYERQAIIQQNKLKKMPTLDESFQYWALNDVATCYYIEGQIYFYQKKYYKAEDNYKKVIRKFPYAQYYNPAGYTVKVAESCEKNLVAIDALRSQKQESSKQEEGIQRIDIREKLKEQEENSKPR